MSLTPENIIAQTTYWINHTVIACNFCPFATGPMLRKSIRYVVLPAATLKSTLEALVDEWQLLDRREDIETTLLIFPGEYADFETYLDLVDLAEALSAEQGYEGIYQIASFHPDYCFAGSKQNDPANYTNRSPYPMLHLLREDSITKAVTHFEDPEGIPAQNIAFAQLKGLAYMQSLFADALAQR